jgi:hypothetical protein
MKVIWKPVIGYEGIYEVSDSGLVRSNRGLLSGYYSCGYRIVTLSRGGINKQKKVSRLVLSAHKYPMPSSIDACHNDGDRSNDNLSNLRWDTRKGNMADTVTHGTRLSGSKNGNSALSKNDVNKIIELINSGESYSIIGKVFNVSKQALCNIKKGVSYKLEAEMSVKIKTVNAFDFCLLNIGEKFKVFNGSTFWDCIKYSKKLDKCVISMSTGGKTIRYIDPKTQLIISNQREKQLI